MLELFNYKNSKTTYSYKGVEFKNSTSEVFSNHINESTRVPCSPSFCQFLNEIDNLSYGWSENMKKSLAYDDINKVYASFDNNTYTLKMSKENERIRASEIYYPVIWAAILPFLYSDPEFRDAWELLPTLVKGTDIKKCISQLGYNAEIRSSKLPVTDPYYINVVFPKDGSFSFLDIESITLLKNSLTVMNGFKELKNTSKNFSESDISMKYCFGEEVAPDLICPYPQGYVPTSETIEICKLVSSRAVRNIGIFGPAGVGKSKMTEAVANACGKPLLRFTCNPSTDSLDLIGSYIPTTIPPTEDPLIRKRMNVLSQLNQTDFSLWKYVEGIPSTTDIENHKTQAAEMLHLPANSAKETIFAERDKIIKEKIDEYIKASPEGHKFNFIESPIIKALRYGYFVEIQESNLISLPGIILSLNSLLEVSEGEITLQTGEVLKRHPDSVVFITNNTDYEGCKVMNIAHKDRFDVAYHLTELNAKVLVERAMSSTGVPYSDDLEKMVKTIIAFTKAIKEKGITTGIAGFRSLKEWIKVNQVLDNTILSAERTVISKISNDEVVRREFSILLHSIFNL